MINTFLLMVLEIIFIVIAISFIFKVSKKHKKVKSKNSGIAQIPSIVICVILCMVLLPRAFNNFKAIAGEFSNSMNSLESIKNSKLLKSGFGILKTDTSLILRDQKDLDHDYYYRELKEYLSIDRTTYDKILSYLEDYSKDSGKKGYFRIKKIPKYKDLKPYYIDFIIEYDYYNQSIHINYEEGFTEVEENSLTYSKYEFGNSFAKEMIESFFKMYEFDSFSYHYDNDTIVYVHKG